MRVAVGGNDLDEALAHVQHGHVERAATQVKDQDALVLLPIKPIGQCGGRRLVDNTQHFQTGNTPGVLGRLALAIIEISRHRDDRLGHRLAQVIFGVLLHLGQDHRRDLLRRVGLVLHGDANTHVALRPLLDGVRQAVAVFHGLRIVEMAADEPLHGKNCVFGVNCGLALGGLADQPLAALREGDN